MFHIILFAFYCDKYIIKTLIKKKIGNISWNSDSKVVNRNIKNLKNNVMAGTAFKVITFVEPKR